MIFEEVIELCVGRNWRIHLVQNVVYEELQIKNISQIIVIKINSN